MCFGVWCQWSSSLAGKYSPKPALMWIEFGVDRVWCSGALMWIEFGALVLWCWIEFGALMWIESGVDRVCCG